MIIVVAMVGMKGHNFDHGNNTPCKLCGKIHKVTIHGKGGMRGHNFDHDNGTICKKCGLIHKAKIHRKGGIHGHNWDHGIGDVCKKCGKIHKKGGPNGKSGPRGHNWDHGKGDVCQKCGKVHNKTQKKDFQYFMKMIEKEELSINNSSPDKIITLCSNFRYFWRMIEFDQKKYLKQYKKISEKSKAFYNTPEGKQIQRSRASKSFLGHNYDHGAGDICKKCGKIHIGGMTGRTHTAEAREKIGNRVYSKEALKIFSDTMKRTRAKIIFPKHDSNIEKIVQARLAELNISFTKQKLFYLSNGTTHKTDLFFESTKLCVEIDGCWHHACPTHHPEGNGGEDRRKLDAFITKELQIQGLIVLRFWGHDIKGKGKEKDRLDWVIETILNTIKSP